MIKKLLILILILSILPGCKKDSQDDNPVIPDISFKVTLNGVPETVVGIEGSPQSIPFQIGVTTNDGLLVSNKTVSLSITEGVGSFEAAEIETNSFGQASGLYNVEMPSGQTLVTITARVESFSTTASFRLIGLNRPASLIIEPQDREFIVGSEESFELPIKATIRDIFGNAVQGINLRFGLMVDSSIVGSRVFGTMTQANSTNANGESVSVFRPNGEYGRQKIFCQINEPGGFLSEIRNETSIAILPLENQINFFRIQSDRELMNISPAQPETARVNITIRDLHNNGLGGIRPEISVNIGGLRGSALTNENGQAEMLYVVDHLDIPDTATVAIIRGTIPRTTWESRASITLMPVAASNPELSLMTDTHVIYADEGVTAANLTAVIRTESGDPLPNQLVEFSTTHGIALSPIRTDENGYARSIFTDVGQASVDEDGNPDSSIVTARIRILNLESTVRIMIHPFDNITSFTLRPESNTIPIGEDNSMQIRARIMKAGNIPIRDGFQVNFTSISGRISPPTAYTTMGEALSEYFPPLFVGVDTLQAWIISDGEIMTASTAIQITPGIPGRITVSADPEIIIANDPNSFSNISASVFDEYNNPVESGIRVLFETTLGTIQQAVSTDENGVAIAQLRSGIRTGIAVVTASVRAGDEILSSDVNVTIAHGEIAFLELEADPAQIAVPEGGAGERTTLRAILRDGNGNLVEVPKSVIFELQGEPMPPLGCIFLDNSQRFITQTNTGVAVARLESGRLAGMKRLRVYSFRDQAQQDTVEANIQVLVIPGMAIDVDMNYSMTGWDAGNPIWGINVVAMVYDRWGNPIPDGTPVDFEIEPEIAEISNGSVGNRNRAGESHPGMAFTVLTYESGRTFATVDVLATIETPDGRVSGDIDFQLPLQNGHLTAAANVGNWHFEEGQENANIEISAVLRDGHDELINNGEVVFSTDAGHLRWYNLQTEEFEELDRSNAPRITGLIDPENSEEPGTATIYFQATADEIFQDPEDVQQRIFIDVRLHHYAGIEVDPIILLFTRVIE